MLQASSDRSGKQQQEENSPNLAKAFLVLPCICTISNDQTFSQLVDMLEMVQVFPATTCGRGCGAACGGALYDEGSSKDVSATCEVRVRRKRGRV